MKHNRFQPRLRAPQAGLVLIILGALLAACTTSAGGSRLSVSPHPRLFFTDENMRQFRDRVGRDEVVRQAWLDMLERADRLLEDHASAGSALSWLAVSEVTSPGDEPAVGSSAAAGQAHVIERAIAAHSNARRRNRLLGFTLRQRVEIPCPLVRRPAEDLHSGRKLATLAYRAPSDAEEGRTGLCSRRADVCAAPGAEQHRVLVPACRRLDVAARLSFEDLEPPIERRHEATKSRARKGLAVQAVTDPHAFRVDLCFVLQMAAVTASIDLHFTLLQAIATHSGQT